VAYSAPEGGHNCAPAHVGRRELLTTFLPPFVAAMEAGAQAAMVSYNEVDGEPNAASAYLLSDLLRHGANSTGGNGPSGGAAKGGWGGYISSDFGAIHNLAHAHGVAATDADAIAQYIGAGGSVQGFDYDHQTWHDAIVNKTADGSLPMAALDAAVARVLAVKEQLGLTAAHATVANTSAYEALVTSAAHEAVALDAARRGMTLLQNEVDTGGGLPSPARVLPLDAAKLRSVLVLGPNADQPQCGDYAAGGSWGGDRCGGGPINNARTSSIVGGIKRLLKLEAAAGVDLAYYPGIPIADRNGSAPYYTTVQRHSFTTTVAASATSEEEAEVEGITGTYWASADRSGAPAFSRNDGLLSFHFLNFGPDPVLLPASAFSARWEGTLTPDTTVAAALFSIAGRGGDANATLWLDGVMVLDWQQGGSASCAAAARGEVPHEEEAEEGEEPRRPNNNGVPFHGRTAEAAKRPCTAADPQLTQLPVSLTRGAPLKVRFEYAQADSTGQHPAFALQWSLQGARSQHDALAEIASLPQEGAAVVLAVGGGTSVTSGEGVDRASLGLPGAQLAFVKGVRAACVRRGVPLALVVSQGKAFGEQWIKASMPAVLETWQGGQAQGQATAETLFGANNPAGRTAVSFPVSADVLPVFYNRKPTAGRGGYSNPPTIPGGLYPPASASSASVLWPFGHGLSYGATFEYGKIALSPSVAEASAAGGAVKVSFDVTNNGTAAAEEVVQLYVRDDLATVTTPVMQLRAFARLPALEPGATRRVTLALDVLRDLWLVDRDLQKVVEPGTFTLMVGGASDKIQQTASLAVSAPPRAPPIPTNQKVQKNQYRQ
jgi:beta-glucosidase